MERNESCCRDTVPVCSQLGAGRSLSRPKAEESHGRVGLSCEPRLDGWAGRADG